MKQLADWDAECRFTKRWLPELRDQSPEAILHHHDSPLSVYPPPVIEFASRTTDERAQVARFIGFLTSRPGTIPALSVTPRVLAAGDNYNPDEPLPKEELDDPLLELLRGHESLGQDEFLQKLRQQRSSEEVTSA